MKFLSTRDSTQNKVSIRQALEAGLAPDGGLYVPEGFPAFQIEEFESCETLAETALVLLKPFFSEDPELALALPEICARTFDFPIPLTEVKGRPGDFILELFHGPTSAFKDVGARFLANVMEKILETKPEKRTVIVATSGDTGGAVAGAFFGKKNLDVVILYPQGKISSRQEKQLCAWGGNIRAFAVYGTFDDCQRVVKEALLDRTQHHWISANSINLGRILPQMVYYAFASLHFARQGLTPNFIIPSGNLGNSLACLWVKKLCLPVGEIHLALNANRGVLDFLETGSLANAPTISTLANAMDVSRPSNLERMQKLYLSYRNFKSEVSADSVSDDEIKQEIKTSEAVWEQVLCPHTAVAAVVRKRLKNRSGIWVIAATAHPAKFETIVEPLIGHAVPIPEPLAKILARPSVVKEMNPSYAELLSALKN
jgi:threonine synthase